MPVSVSHVLSATTPDNPQYEIRPSHWNSSHAFTANLVGSEISNAFSNAGNVSFGFDGTNITATANAAGAGDGFNRISAGTQIAGTNNTISFANSNGISFGLSNSSVMTASYTVPSTAGLLSNINVSAGTTSNNLSAVTFADSNGISFGLNGSVVTGTVATNYLTSQSNQAFSAPGGSSAFQTLVFANSQGVSWSNSNGSVVATVKTDYLTTQTNQTLSFATASNSAGNTGAITVDARSLTLAGYGDISVGYSTSAGGSTILVSGTQTVQTQASGNIARTGFTTATTAGSVLVGTLDTGGLNLGVPKWLTAAAGGGFSAGVSTLGNSSGQTGVTGTQLVFAGGNNITLSQNTDANGATITVSGANAGGAQTGISGIIVSNTTYTSGTVSFSNLNGISFGSVNATAISASYTVPTQTNQTLGIYNSSQTTGQSSSSTYDARSLTIAYSGNISGGWTNGSMLLNVTTAAQTNQTVGVYGSSQTTGSASSGTHDARSLSFIGAGIISVGNHSTSAGGTTTGIIISATQSNQAASANNGSVAFQTLSFSNVNNVSFATAAGPAIQGSFALNVSATGGTSVALSGLTFKDSQGVSFGLSTGVGVGTITASVSQSNQTLGIYASSNTTGASSSSTYDARSLTIVGSDNISVGWTNGSFMIKGAAGGGVTPVASASNGSFSFTTLAFSNANNVTFGTSAGSIITASVAAPGAAAENNWVNLLGANTAGNTTASGSTIGYSGINITLSGTNNSVVNISAPATSSLSQTNGLSLSTNGSTISIGVPPLSVWEPYALISSTAYSSHAPASWWFNRFLLDDAISFSNINMMNSMNAVVASASSVASTGTARFSYSKGVTIFTRQDMGANSTRLSYLTTGSFGLTAGLSYSSTSQSLVVSYVTNSTGGTTSFNTTSNSNGWTSFLTGPKLIQIPMVTSLSAGEYFIAHAHSSTSGTTQSNITLVSMSQLHQAWPVVTFGQLGSTVTNASSSPTGIGVGIASAVTTNNTMAASVISWGTNNLVYFNLSNA